MWWCAPEDALIYFSNALPIFQNPVLILDIQKSAEFGVRWPALLGIRLPFFGPCRWNISKAIIDILDIIHFVGDRIFFDFFQCHRCSFFCFWGLKNWRKPLPKFWRCLYPLIWVFCFNPSYIFILNLSIKCRLVAAGEVLELGAGFGQDRCFRHRSH